MKATKRRNQKGSRAQKFPWSLQWGAFRKPLLIMNSRRLEILLLGLLGYGWGTNGEILKQAEILSMGKFVFRDL